MALRSGAKMMVLVSGFIAFTLLAGSMSASAALLCRSALLIPPTQEHIDSTLNDLARMKLEIDLEKARGSSANDSKVAALDHSDFIKKRKEFLEKTGMEVSDFTQKLKSRIALLQGKVKETKKTESVRRAEEKQILRVPKFKFQETIPLPDGLDIQWIHQLTYLEKQHGLLFLQQGFLRFLDIKTGKVIQVASGLGNARISRDRKHVYSVGTSGLLTIYSTETLALSRTLQLDVASLDLTNRWNQIYSIDASPSGDKLVLSSNNLTVFSLVDGSVQSQGKGSGDARFRDEDMIVFSSNHAFGKYDLKTDQVTSVTYESGPNGNIPKVEMDPTSNVFLTVNPNGFILHINFESLAILGRTYFESFRGIQNVPHSDGHFVTFSVHQSGGLIADKSPDALLFDFNDKYKGFAADSFANSWALSESGETMFVITSKNPKVSVDIWKDQK